MTERPILFSAPMVRAILEDRKTQTRRVVKPQPHPTWTMNVDKRLRRGIPLGDLLKGSILSDTARFRCPYGLPGDRLWVRETWTECKNCGVVNYAAGWKVVCCKACDQELGAWKPSIHMFREDSRILLEVTDVRVQRVQDISREDAIAEGMPGGQGWPPVEEFSLLWNQINLARGFGWAVNPWVWAISFKRVK